MLIGKSVVHGDETCSTDSSPWSARTAQTALLGKLLHLFFFELLKIIACSSDDSGVVHGENTSTTELSSWTARTETADSADLYRFNLKSSSFSLLFDEVPCLIRGVLSMLLHGLHRVQ
jgi:hypothetical protein